MRSPHACRGFAFAPEISFITRTFSANAKPSSIHHKNSPMHEEGKAFADEIFVYFGNCPANALPLQNMEWGKISGSIAKRGNTNIHSLTKDNSLLQLRQDWR
jgi:hypothetical protein